MAQCLQTVGCNTEVELLEMQQNIAKLKQAADAFQQQGSIPGAHLVTNGLDNLKRQVFSAGQSTAPRTTLSMHASNLTCDSALVIALKAC